MRSKISMRSAADLLKSPRHRDSILWDKVQEVGVGIAVNEHGDYWITEMFALSLQ